FFTNDEDVKVSFSVEEEIVELPAGAQPGTVCKTIADVPHQYVIADTAEKRKSLITLLNQQKSLCFDTETTGIDALRAELVGMSSSIQPNEGYWVPVPADQDETRKIVGEFKALFENEKI